jgi:hypothetical protein
MNIDLVVLTIWNLLTSNSLIQLSPDFNWNPQILQCFFSHENCYPCVVFGPGACLHFQRKVGRFHLRNVVPVLPRTASIKFTTDKHFHRKCLKYFVEIILKLKFLIYRIVKIRKNKRKSKTKETKLIPVFVFI